MLRQLEMSQNHSHKAGLKISIPIKGSIKLTKVFTLIELLVVISIISILISILLPALAKARSTAQTTVCANHVKTFGIANLVYTQEYKDKLCPSRDVNSKVMYQILEPYGIDSDSDLAVAKTTYTGKMAQCPRALSTPYQDKPWTSYNFSYAGNLNAHIYSDKTIHIKLSSIVSPSRIISVVETALQTRAWGRDDGIDQDEYYTHARTRHNQGSNYLLMDGHVNFHKPPKDWLTVDTEYRWNDPGKQGQARFNFIGE